MLNRIITSLLLICSLTVAAQYKNDNVLFKTVDPSDLCQTLAQNKGYVLLDVRSHGEHIDSANAGVYNLGHLKGAINIDVQELGARLSEIKAYKDQPVFVYCSHSQRSRRASKMLADSGYTKVFNINGGMTAIYYTDASGKDCLRTLVETNNKYNTISGTTLCQKVAGKNNVFVLDVRSDSAFRHISTDPQANAYGAITGAVNIPVNDLENRMSTIPQDREIIVVDLFGSDAAKAATILKNKGYSRVSVLVEGMSRWIAMDDPDPSCKKQWYQAAVPYQLMPATEFGQYAKANSDYKIVDVRSVDEFTNKSKDYWRNIGHLKNAMNIPAADLAARVSELSDYRDKDVVLYSFSTSPEVFAAANTLRDQGFTKVKVLMGGVFNLRWTAANRKGQSYLKDFVTDVPEINW